MKSRPDIKVWKDDPLFQTNEDVPFVSSLSHSHLITRAVMMNDMKLLKKCIDDRKVISRINPRRSLAVPLGNFKYILSNKYTLKLFFTDFVSDFQSDFQFDFEFDFKSDFRIQFSNYNFEFQFWIRFSNPILKRAGIVKWKMKSALVQMINLNIFQQKLAGNLHNIILASEN